MTKKKQLLYVCNDHNFFVEINVFIAENINVFKVPFLIIPIHPSCCYYYYYYLSPLITTIHLYQHYRRFVER